MITQLAKEDGRNAQNNPLKWPDYADELNVISRLEILCGK